ncbi:MAG: metallophosphoesterase family protein, partial [Candidatus Glassbacteria bacterium]|nr:metallophosphoesterase family protein [Candidatus Glassbacteria bacterium]
GTVMRRDGLRYAVISDIHGNLQALEAVLEKIDRLEPDRVICLGDIVGYGADPSACIELVRAQCSAVIMGNHDAAAVERTSIAFFNPVAREAALWTREVLNAREKEYLKQLPLTAQMEGFEIVHSSPDDPEKWHYMHFSEDAEGQFGYFEGQLLFFGHTHCAVVFELDSDTLVERWPDDFRLRDGSRYMVNVGSVGQPRDGEPGASFAVFDSLAGEIAFYRQPYDIATAAERILEAGLPEMLASRLAVGR